MSRLFPDYDAALTVALPGDLQHGREEELERIVDEFEASPYSHLNLDVTGVESLDSTGLSALVMLNVLAQSRGGEVRLDGAGGQLVHTLRDTGLDQLVVVEGDRSERA